MKLLIISHTDHYVDAHGRVLGWGPTVREIDAIAGLFDEVVHIACLYNNQSPPASSVPYASNKVRFVGIDPFGGKGFKNKLNILSSAFHNIGLIKKELRTADVFHFRAPTSIGLYVIPYLTLSKKQGWYKYAGNWVQKKGPLSYRLQKWMLLNIQSRKVTINGKWPDQPVNCLSFRNPCLYDTDISKGEAALESKVYAAPFRLCFAGRLDEEKGVYRLLDAIKGHPNKSLFHSLDIAGDGPHLNALRSAAKDIGIDIFFHGALNRDQLFDMYQRSHFILLPSDSEGFPKVIAEAANFGCIPVVSDVSAVSQYVNNDNGFLWNADERSFSEFFADLDLSQPEVLRAKALNAHKMADSFTYTHYLTKLKSEVLA